MAFPLRVEAEAELAVSRLLLGLPALGGSREASEMVIEAERAEVAAEEVAAGA